MEIENGPFTASLYHAKTLLFSSHTANSKRAESCSVILFTSLSLFFNSVFCCLLCRNEMVASGVKKISVNFVKVPPSHSSDQWWSKTRFLGQISENCGSWLSLLIWTCRKRNEYDLLHKRFEQTFWGKQLVCRGQNNSLKSLFGCVCRVSSYILVACMISITILTYFVLLRFF